MGSWEGSRAIGSYLGSAYLVQFFFFCTRLIKMIQTAQFFRRSTFLRVVEKKIAIGKHFLKIYMVKYTVHPINFEKLLLIFDWANFFAVTNKRYFKKNEQFRSSLRDPRGTTCMLTPSESSTLCNQ